MNGNGAIHARGGAARPSIWSRVCIFPFILGIRAYQVTLAPLMSGHCRFLPTCSNYALEAYRVHGPLRGTWLTARRLLRCHPWGGHGYDPVPLPQGETQTPKTDELASQKN